MILDRRRQAGRPASLLFAAVLLVGCAESGASARGTPAPATPQSSASAAVSQTPARAEASAATDIDALLSSLEQIHPEPYHGVSEEEFVAAAEHLKETLPSLGPDEAMVELMRLTAMISRNGRDGHLSAVPTNDSNEPMLPIRIYHFADGWHITDALGHAELVGHELLEIGGQPIDAVVSAVEPLVPRDGPATVPAFLPRYLLRASVLDGLGLLSDTASIEVATSSVAGETLRTALRTVTRDEYLDWASTFGDMTLPLRDETLYLRGSQAPAWIDRSLGDGRLYLRYARIQPGIGRVAEELRTALDEGISEIIVDLRQNLGGENGTYPPLLSALRDADARGITLYVITDRLTFSAAANFATELEQSTAAIYVGEAPGGGLNFWSDTVPVSLPNYPVPMTVNVPRRYWQKAPPDDPRLTIEPDHPVEVTSGNYFAGEDPVIEFIIGLP